MVFLAFSLISQFTCEPLRSFEEGLCPFAPSDDAVRQRQALEQMTEEVNQLRLRLDRWATASACYTVFS